MLKTRLVLLLSAVSAIVMLFFLPKVVVDDETATVDEKGDTKVNEKKGPNPMGLDPSHTLKLNPEKELSINRLKETLKHSTNNKKSAIFADSLAISYRKVNRLDSAAKYAALVTDYIANEDNWQKAGDAYYDAFKFSMDAEKAKALGGKVRLFYQKVLDISPEKLDLKAKIAVTLTATENPMKGIFMLRDVLHKDPNNQVALYNIGLMSIKTGQYRKAVQRFQKLAALDTGNYEPHFYMGIGYKELGEIDSARNALTTAKELVPKDQVDLISTIGNYLEELDSP